MDVTMKRTAAVLPLLIACSAETLPLDERDGGFVARDVGVTPPYDAGPRDAGFRPDADVPRDAGEVFSCPPAMANFGFGASDQLPVGTMEGIARITSLSPFTFQMGADRIEVPFRPPEALRLVPLSMIAWVRLDVVRPFWTETRLVVRNLEPDDSPGALLFAAWEGSEFDTDPELSYSYQDNGCAVAFDDCGDNRGLDLVVDMGGRSISASYGSLRRTDDGWAVHSGSSSHYVDGPFCPDTPGAWYHGFVVAEHFPALPCRELRRDTCNSVSGCTLFGEENGGSGYSCEPVVNACERQQTTDLCTNINGCTWDSGGCYCGEADVCACAGGPAPACRTFCSAVGCPSENGASERYCYVPTTAAPQCDPVRSPSYCDWRPPTCTGAMGLMQCACTANGFQTFANDCERRMSEGGTFTVGACN